jgi:hypothetical protein
MLRVTGLLPAGEAVGKRFAIVEIVNGGMRLAPDIALRRDAER